MNNVDNNHFYPEMTNFFKGTQTLEVFTADLSAKVYLIGNEFSPRNLLLFLVGLSKMWLYLLFSD